MGKIKEVLKDISRTRNVEREFASDAERRVVQRKISEQDTLTIKSQDLKEFD